MYLGILPASSKAWFLLQRTTYSLACMYLSPYSTIEFFNLSLILCTRNPLPSSSAAETSKRTYLHTQQPYPHRQKRGSSSKGLSTTYLGT